MPPPVGADGMAMLTDRTTRAPGTAQRAPGTGPPGPDHAAGPGHGASPSGGPTGRTRFSLHALALLVVLVATVAWIDNGHSAITDEGAVVAQVDAASEGQWRIERPFAAQDPTFDPEGRFAPMELSVIAEGTYIPYGKHPAYPALLVPFWALGGHFGLLVASAIGAWAAAVAGALLARRVAGTTPFQVLGRSVRPDVVTLWFLGVASPLVFDATVVMAHGLGAASVGFATLAVLRCLEAPTVRAATGAGAVALALAACAVLVRSEGLLAVGALSLTLGVMGLGWFAPGTAGSATPSRTRSLGLGGALAITGAAAYLLDGRLAALVAGSDGLSAFTTTQDGYDLIDGRAQALWASVVRPGGSGMGTAALVLATGALCLIAAGLLLRRAGTPSVAGRTAVPGLVTAVAVLAAVGALCVLARHGWPPAIVTGLLPTAPVLVVGLVQLRRTDLRATPARLCVLASAVTAVAIWLTSYSIGGAVEWGGRFFHVLLPLLAPLAVLGLARAATILGDGWNARVVVVAFLVAPLASSALWLRTDVAMRENSATIATSAIDAARSARPPADGGAPVVLSDPRGLGRTMWPHLDELRFLRVEQVEELAEVLERLHDRGVDTVTLATSPRVPVGALLGGRWDVHREHPSEMASWRFLELHAA